MVSYKELGLVNTKDMFAKAVKIYESYVYTLTAIGVGIVAAVFSLFAFVLTGVESVTADIVDTGHGVKVKMNGAMDGSHGNTSSYVLISL